MSTIRLGLLGCGTVGGGEHIVNPDLELGAAGSRNAKNFGNHGYRIERSKVPHPVTLAFLPVLGDNIVDELVGNIRSALLQRSDLPGSIASEIRATVANTDPARLAVCEAGVRATLGELTDTIRNDIIQQDTTDNAQHPVRTDHPLAASASRRHRAGRDLVFGAGSRGHGGAGLDCVLPVQLRRRDAGLAAGGGRRWLPE